MTHAQIDDRFDDHPSYADYGAAEMGVLACAITYANRNLTDGVIPSVWPRRRFGRQGADVAKRLVADGRWLLREDGGFEIVGFLDHNPSKAEVARRRAAVAAAKAAAGEKGGRRSGEVRREKTSSARHVDVAPTSSARHEDVMATSSARHEDVMATSSARHEDVMASEQDHSVSKANAKQEASTRRSPLLSTPLLSTPLRESESAPVPAESTAKPPATERTIPLPFAGEPAIPMTPDFELTSEARAAADNLGIRDIDLVWRGFCAHHIEKGTLPMSARQWIQGAWGKWITRQPGFQKRDRERDRAREPIKQVAPGFKPKMHVIGGAPPAAQDAPERSDAPGQARGVA